MSKLGVWQILSDTPKKLNDCQLDLEKQLEDWIEQDPGLLQNGLTIVARQMTFPGGRLDLLALDPQGRWVIIEIKAGAVRNDTIGQSLYYAAVVSTMSASELQAKVNDYLVRKSTSLSNLLKERGLDISSLEQDREVTLALVGTSQAPGLDKVVNYLSGRYEFPISVTSYQVFELASGERVLVRELTEADIPTTTVGGLPKKSQLTLDQLKTMARANGSGPIFEALLEGALRHDLHPRAWPTSIMYAPQQNKTRMLFTVWTYGKHKGALTTYIGPEVFAEFYPISEEKAKDLLGPSGWREMDEGAARNFLSGLDALFKEIKQPSGESD